MPDHVILVGGKKFLWDGIDYPDGDELSAEAKKFRADGFDVEVSEQEGKIYLYSRRVAQQGVAPNA